MNSLRLEKIKKYVEERNSATIKELKSLFPDISLMTLHRDLDCLERSGVISKFRGGVRSVHHFGDMEFSTRLRDNNDGKLIMAKKAVKLLQPHSSVFLDAGTSNLILAKNIPDININIITTSPPIAIELCKLSTPTVIVCCGTLNRNNLTVSGHNTLEMLKNINIDLAFLGVSGASAEDGFTCGTEADMLVKTLVIKKARTSVIMCGSDKLKSLMPYTFANMNDVDIIISDRPLPEEYTVKANRSGVNII